MKKLIKLLTEAEAEAKRLADLNPKHSGAQAVRARVLAAKELAESPACKEVKETDEAPAAK